MANVVRDPQKHPEAVEGDFSKPNPLVTFKLSDVAFTYGDKWKQRYFYKRGNDFVYPAQWDVQNRTWRAYHPAAGTDWWVALSGRQRQRPTGPLCDGCHSVNYNSQTKTSSSGTSVTKNVMVPGRIMFEQPSRSQCRQSGARRFRARQRLCISATHRASPSRIR